MRRQNWVLDPLEILSGIWSPNYAARRRVACGALTGPKFECERECYLNKWKGVKSIAFLRLAVFGGANQIAARCVRAQNSISVVLISYPDG